ncbi:MAG: type III pantothenate kinase [Prevotellaceae bacterium]|jgi:type III pantothenate kinase|nr:type III pantothenate kinase [Prevotellaceae bacterium]
MNLTIDQGNSYVKAGVFDGNKLLESIVFEETQMADRLMFLLMKYPIQNYILSSVSNDAPLNVVNYLKSQGGMFIVLDENTPLPIKNRYKTPVTLGKDRLAAAVAAYALKPNVNSLVIDIGTCITYDFVNSKGEFLGGGISPGMKMRFRALNAFTKRLPLIEAAENNTLLGDDTESAIRSGVVNGIIFEIDGCIEHLKEKFPDLTVFLSGGDTFFFANTFKSSIFADKNLLLVGLNRILNYNLENV